MEIIFSHISLKCVHIAFDEARVLRIYLPSALDHSVKFNVR